MNTTSNQYEGSQLCRMKIYRCYRLCGALLSFLMVFYTLPPMTYADVPAVDSAKEKNLNPEISTESVETSAKSSTEIPSGSVYEDLKSDPLSLPDESDEAPLEQSDSAAGASLSESTQAGSNLILAGGATTSRDTKAPRISKITCTNLAATSATITWSTDEVSDSQIAYGTTSSLGQISLLDANMVLNHSVNLSGLSSATTYYYQIRTRDASGNIKLSSISSFKTLTQDTVPPTISAVTSTNVSYTSATVNWTTNEASDSQIEFGKTTSYGSVTAVDSKMVTSHVVNLTNLESSVLYHYRIISKDAAGNRVVSQDFTFQTLTPDTTPPAISAVTVSALRSIDATIQWTTNEASTTQIEFGTTIAYGNLTTLSSTMVTNHSQVMPGLSPSTVYHYRVLSKDAAGNLSVSQDYILTTQDPDITSPTISAVATSSVKSIGFTATWTTNETSDTQVEYGTTSDYGKVTTVNSALVTSHTTTITGLIPDTEYHFRVKSKDEFGNLSVSQDYVIRTLVNQAPTGEISLNQLDADYTVDGYQVFTSSPWTNITYSSKVTDMESDAVNWSWSYRLDGGAEVLYSQGTGLLPTASIDYKGRLSGLYEWILRMSDATNMTEKRFVTQVIPGTWASSITPTIYLDFDGNYISQWGSYSNITTPRYDSDGYTGGFSWNEIVAAGQVLLGVAEKFSPFNIGVSLFDYFVPTKTYATQAEEAADRYAFYEQNKILQVSIGGNGSWTGGNWGGMAYVGSYSSATPNAVFVYEDNLQSAAKYITQAAAHESGHAFGLGHESLYDANGNFVTEYYQGTSAWAPIMGNSYYSAQSTWWTGEGNEPASMRTDEIATIASSANGFGFRPDDHGDTTASASQFHQVSGTTFKDNGIITKLTDADYFKFTLSQAGAVNFTASVSSLATMLNLKLELHDANDALLMTVDTASLGETLSTTLASGTYYLVVKSHGRYGDLGQYWITGTLPNGSTTSAGAAPLSGAQNVLKAVTGVSAMYSGGSAAGGSVAKSSSSDNETTDQILIKKKIEKIQEKKESAQIAGHSSTHRQDGEPTHDNNREELDFNGNVVLDSANVGAQLPSVSLASATVATQMPVVNSKLQSQASAPEIRKETKDKVAKEKLLK